MNQDLDTPARAVFDACIARRIMVATAESCTGGMIAAALTDIPGSSAVLERGYVSYSNHAKVEMLGVNKETLRANGAVSGETAAAMAVGALRRSRASLAVAVTGIAGPGGGSADKPVGLVWFGIATKGGEVRSRRIVFEDQGRAFIRTETARAALAMLLEAASTFPVKR